MEMKYFGWGLVLNGYVRPVAHSQDGSLRERVPVVLENQVGDVEEKATDSLCRQGKYFR